LKWIKWSHKCVFFVVVSKVKFAEGFMACTKGHPFTETHCAGPINHQLVGV
jgi:hypothetical protein